MQFSQIQHCSVVVQNLERAAAFYREVLGLTEIEIPSTFKPAGLKVRWFRLGTQQIHLLHGAENPPGTLHHAGTVFWSFQSLSSRKVHNRL